jgi:hypothetical protein
MAEVLTGVLRLYRRFTFDLCPVHHPDQELKIGEGVIAIPADGIWVYAKLR